MSRHEIKQYLFKLLKAQRLTDLDVILSLSKDVRLGRNNSRDVQYPGSIDLDFVLKVRKIFGLDGIPARVTSLAEDLFLRRRVEPIQSMFSSWMDKARAEVAGEKIPFKEIISWCQNCRETEKREILRKEALALCRFLAPFSHATWQALIGAVTQDLGYKDYYSFCQTRRERSLSAWARFTRRYLKTEKAAYFSMIGPWLGSVTGQSVTSANRFDAIYLLGLRYLDHLFPQKGIDSGFSFLESIGLRNRAQGLTIHIDGTPGRQSYCVPVEIPNDIRVICGPVQGWVDWEALFHELGHAFSFIFTDPDLPLEEREFFFSGEISESFAFLFQRLSMKKPFLEGYLGLSSQDASRLEKAQEMKFEVLTRRYGAKFLIEETNFKKGYISRGQKLYARIMKEETGFSYDPETYLFDIMPDFYSFDYFIAFLASNLMQEWLMQRYGDMWFQDKGAWNILKQWASWGNRYSLSEFLGRALGTETVSSMFTYINLKNS